MDIEGFISRAQLRLSSEPVDGNPDLYRADVPSDGEHYACTVRGRTHEMTFHFTCPPGDGPPEIEDAVRYLGAVAAEYEDCDDILEWADEFGLDPGHLDTRDAYDALGRITRDLWRLVGDEMYDELRYGMEIEQAIDMAWAGFGRG